MKIAFIYNKNNHQYDYETEFDSEETIDALISAIGKNFEIIPIEATRDQSLLINTIQKANPDLIFSVAEGYHGPAREAFYPALYDQLNFPCAGPDATNLLICHNKYLSKTLLEKQGIPVTRSFVINKLSDLKQTLQDFTYPLFVKYNSEGSGMGVDKNSKVNDFQELKTKVSSLLKIKPSNVLVEEFVSGIDIGCAYVEGLGVFPPCQVISDDNSEIYDYEHKTSLDYLVKIIPLDASAKIIDDITTICSRAISSLDIRGYAKVDLRLNDNGCKIVEINGQVSFHPKGEFMVSVESKKSNMTEIIKHIINYRLRDDFHYSSGYKEINYDR